MIVEFILAAAALAWAVGSLLLVRHVVLSERRSPRQLRRIVVDGGYRPSEVHVPAGEPVRLVFRREETAACSERVVFPDYGMSVMLPPFEDVAIDLPAGDPDEHEFTCQMRMLSGRIVVDRVVATDREPGSHPIGTASYQT